MNAWVSDDAYITFRTLDNFFDGHGLRWNIAERVQTYTHPLWMGVIGICYFFTGNAYYSAIMLSLTFSVLSLLVVSRALEQRQHGALLSWLILIVLLISSKAFMDYTSSGLENPLSYFLVSLLYAPLLTGSVRASELSYRQVRHCFLLAALLFVNRQDTLLLTGPLLFYLFRLNRPQLKGAWPKIAFWGSWPAVGWLLFALFYYGFVFPNTAYAKLNTTFSTYRLLQQGLAYFFNSLAWDPVTLPVIFTAVGLSIFNRDSMLRWVALGAFLYLGYVLKIGGCFMSGRFFSVLYLVAVLLLLRNLQDRRIQVCLLIFACLMSVLRPSAPVQAAREYKSLGIDINGIADERGFYLPTSGLVFYRPDKPLPQNSMLTEGKQLKSTPDRVVFRPASIGFYGYAAGPKKHIIDSWALADPLLARLPSSGRIGHFPRSMPEGYYETVQTAANRIEAPSLRQYYDHLAIIIKGPLFSLERFKTIIRMNIGGFQHLIDSYRKQTLK